MADVTATIVPRTQGRYQLRFDFGLEGLARVGSADVVIWVDSLGDSAAEAANGAVGEATSIIAADLRNRSAAARWVLDHQLSLGRRVSIAVVAAGRDGGFASNDLLAAGAIIDALTTLGIDFTSPEAAVSSAAFGGLRNAVGHLFTASVSGQELAAQGERELVVAASKIDSSTEVPILKLAD